MMNTVSDLAGENFSQVSALLENQGGPVEINAVIMGRLRSGVLVTIHACGDMAPSCASDIRVFCSDGAIRTGAWGESLDVLRRQPSDWRATGSRDQGWEPVPVRDSRGVWEESSPPARASSSTPPRRSWASAWPSSGTPSTSPPPRTARPCACSPNPPPPTDPNPVTGKRPFSPPWEKVRMRGNREL